MKSHASRLARITAICTLLMPCGPFARGGEAGEAENGGPSVFRAPLRQADDMRIAAETVRLLAAGDYAGAEALLRMAVARSPGAAVHWYNLACAQALQNETDTALESLARAVHNGYLDVTHMREDRDLDSLRDTSRYAEIIEAARAAGEKLAGRKPVPRPVSDGTALVAESNTVWRPVPGVFGVYHAFPDKPASDEIVRGEGRAGDLLRQWYAEGTAAGLHGILYDNHDRRHSMFPCGNVPQLTRVSYCDAARAMHLACGHGR